MKLKILVGLLVFLILVNLATIGSYVYFKWHRGNERPEGPPPPPRAQELLSKMSEDQRKKLHDLIEQFDKDSQEKREQLRKLEGETFSIIRTDSTSADKLNANLAEISRIRLELSQLAAQRLMDAKSFLTAEQRELFFGATTMGGGPGPGHMPGPGPGRRPGPPFGRPFHGGPPPDGMRPDDGPPPDDQGPPPDRDH